EDILRHLQALQAPDAEAYFAELLETFGLGSLPADWRERVTIGADRKHSSTAREHLSGGHVLPASLPDTQKALVEFSAPGLR
ncbi:hypothetical protein, partial [Priestia megaterium]|uniref:hypothetical protein n=1 Tax=Priestia megaterium TaxID=1404 RepID=UPI0035B696E4